MAASSLCIPCYVLASGSFVPVCVFPSPCVEGHIERPPSRAGMDLLPDCLWHQQSLLMNRNVKSRGTEGICSLWQCQHLVDYCTLVVLSIEKTLTDTVFFYIFFSIFVHVLLYNTLAQ